MSQELWKSRKLDLFLSSSEDDETTEHILDKVTLRLYVYCT